MLVKFFHFNNSLKCIIFSAFLALSFGKIHAQDFLLQGWYWDFPKTCDGHNWADTLNMRATDLGAAGFTHVWLPPFSRASFGTCSNGYDPKDLYDLGEFGQGPTHFGTRADVDNLIASLTANGIEPVADVVYNHRDGGTPEDNPAVKDYITNYFAPPKNAFPSDRYRVVLPLGGSSGNDAGDYFFKISSKSQDPIYHNKAYIFRVETSIVGNLMLTNNEVEPNGGGDCSEANNTVLLGETLNASVDGLGCLTDEFKVTITPTDFNAAGDELIIYLTNPNNDYSDHRIYGIWNASASADVANQLVYQTYTDFTAMPSGQGAMNFENFKPNSSNASSTFLSGDWDWLWFFYDYDHTNSDTNTKLFDWTKWLWNDVGIRGFRMDAIKHFDPAFVGDLMDDLHDNGQDPSLVVGEFFDSNPSLLQNWITDVYSNMDADTEAAIDIRIFDFALRQALKDACDWSGYDTRNIFNSGIVDGVGGSGFNVVTFINNHDFRDAGQGVQNDALLAYAYLLTNNQLGIPSIFYPDYYGSELPHAPTQYLKPQIDQLIKIHQDYIFNSTSVDYLNRFGTPYNSNFSSGTSDKTVIYQLSGGTAGREILVAINFSNDDLNVEQEININNLAIADKLYDVVGNDAKSYLEISGASTVNIEIPARSYSVWVSGNCLEELVLNDTYVIPDTYQVKDRILSNGSIQASTITAYEAGNCIELLPNFETELGADFTAEIKTCN